MGDIVWVESNSHWYSKFDASSNCCGHGLSGMFGTVRYDDSDLDVSVKEADWVHYSVVKRANPKIQLAELLNEGYMKVNRENVYEDMNAETTSMYDNISLIQVIEG